MAAPFDDSDTASDKTIRTVDQLAQSMYKTVCTKVRELSSRHPNRKVVLVGWHTTSIINCQVSSGKQVID